MPEEDNSQVVIGIVFDQTYLVYDIGIPMGNIYTILYYNKKAKFVYGGLPRLVNHVEQYAESLKIPKENLIKLDIPCDCSKKYIMTQSKEAQWFLQLLNYKPDKIFVFRDNQHSNGTTTLCQYAQRLLIPVVEYNNRGISRQVTTNTPDSTNNIYQSQFGRVSDYDF